MAALTERGARTSGCGSSETIIDDKRIEVLGEPVQTTSRWVIDDKRIEVLARARADDVALGVGATILPATAAESLVRERRSRDFLSDNSLNEIVLVRISALASARR